LYSFDQVSFRYHEHIFRDYTDEITTAKIGIIGRNGIGKTTLLRLLDHQLFPEKGEVRVDGSTYLVDFDLEKYGAFLIEDLLDVCSHLASFDTSTSSTVMASLSLDGYRRVPISDLSKGTKKKISLLLGLLATPSVLLLDEPFESLDPESNAALVHYIQQREGGVVIVSHEHHLLSSCVGEIFEVTGQRLEKAHDDILG